MGLRDYTDKKREYLDGPSVQLQADGTLVASGKPLTKMPLGKWLHLEIKFNSVSRGQPSPAKSYRLLVAVRGKQPQVFQAVPLRESGVLAAHLVRLFQRREAGERVLRGQREA